MADPYQLPTFGRSLLLRVDGAIGAMSLSPNGRDAVLAGRRGLFIIDLDDPFTTPRWLHHITAWEVADVQWSPHSAKPLWCISTLNQKALLWDLLRTLTNAVQNVLHRHTRAITDINFHPHDPEMLATCLIDTFVYAWDMRVPRRPVLKYSEWRAGATQVKWNHASPHQLVLGHHHDFYVWDSRKGAIPLLKIAGAHNGKINGLDFSGKNLITCSNDKTVKFWPIGAENTENSPKEPTIVLHTSYPVARARPLPFGNDACCGIMPVRGGDDAVHIVNYQSVYDEALASGTTREVVAQPDYSFKGHRGPVKDFLWRTQHGRYEGYASKNPWREYQMVTWSLDYDLKLWLHEDELYNISNYNPLHLQLLDLLVESPTDSPGISPAPSPDLELSQDAAFKTYVHYNSFAEEPVHSWADLAKDAGGDFLSKLTLFRLKQLHEYLSGSAQLNHLNWISGVRLGGRLMARNEDGEEDDGPSNLGEEVSIVGHKFPKLRFEKISVSTGELVLSLRGPLPISESGKPEKERKDELTNSSVIPAQSSANTLLVVGTTAGVSTAAFTTQSIQTTPSGPLVPSTTTTSVARPVPIATSSPGVKQGEFTDSNEQKLVFIRLKVKFPKMYPYLEQIDLRTKGKRHQKPKKSVHVRFDIEETHEISSQVKREMTANLDAIAQFYSNKYNKFCLEPCLRYLMGDKVELDDSLMLERRDTNEDQGAKGLEGESEIGNEGWVDDLIDQHEAAELLAQKKMHGVFDRNEEDDDDDDDDTELFPGITDQLLPVGEGTGYAGAMTNGTEATPLDSNIKHDSTPLPKGCGACWSSSGRLVCFFIPKTTNGDSKGKLGVLKFTENEFSLRSAQLHRRHESDSISLSPVSSIAESPDSNSEEDSGDEGYATSDSSNESFFHDLDEMLEDDVPSRSRIPGMFKGTVAMGRKLIAHEHARGLLDRETSGRGTGSNYKSSTRDGSVVRSSRRNKGTRSIKNVVSIFDFSHLLPDKFELARDYRLLGDDPEALARHNGRVALSHGYNEMSEAWRLVEMILTKDVTTSDLHEYGGEQVGDPGSHIGHFYWGNHPFGHAWLVSELFKYFEKKGHLQMLAMLSCILYDNPANVESRDNCGLKVPVHTPYSVLPPQPSLIAMREHELLAFDEDPVFPQNIEDVVLDNAKLSRKASMMSSRDTLLPRSIPNSLENYQRVDTPSGMNSFKKVPPVVGSGASPMMNSLSSFDFTMERNFRSLDQARRFSKISSARKESKSLLQKKSLYPLTQGTKGKSRPPPNITMQMLNVDSLDFFENVYSKPLLSGVDMEKVYAYREQYAELLFLWGFSINRVKILKFNYADIKNRLQPNARYEVHSLAFGLRSRKALNPNQLLLTPITPIASAKSNAWNTRKRNNLQYCGLCSLQVSKRVVICTKCEHVLHSHCAASWWSTDSDSDEDIAFMECPTGCGCLCLEHSI